MLHGLNNVRPYLALVNGCLGIADIRTESIESPHLLNIVFLQFRFLADGKDLGLRKASMGNFKVGREFRF